MAWATCITKDDPPTVVLSVKVGLMPMYSAVTMVEPPAVKRPSTSLLASPASSRALWAASAWCCRDDLLGTVPMTSDSATPTMAISRCPVVIYRSPCAVCSSPSCSNPPDGTTPPETSQHRHAARDVHAGVNIARQPRRNDSLYHDKILSDASLGNVDRPQGVLRCKCPVISG